MTFKSLWQWDGKVGRGTYALFGIFGLAIKHNLDRFIAYKFGYNWDVLNYLAPLANAARFSPLDSSEKKLLLILLITALPFIWIGVTMTLKRLRDAGQPLWPTILFFAPVINLLFFAILVVLPTDETGYNQASQGAPGTRPVSPYWPTTRTGSAAAAVVITALLGVLVTWGALRLVGNYGLTLFISLPFVMGYLAVMIYSRTQETNSNDVVSVVSLSLLLTGLGITAIAVEGIVCLLMAAPLAWLVAIFGGLLAMHIHGRANSPQATPSMFAVMLVSLPVMFGVEHVAPPPVPRFQVHTTIEIAAPPEVVWKRLIAFPSLPAATEWPFRLGIAYPIEARITGEGLTADRECRFSTGSFKEPILAWEPGKHFAFSVSNEPLLMKETSPYKNIHVRHLEDHDFQPERADFVLISLPNGGTRLEGTTTYQNKMWPGQYWRLWTDAIIHSIHNRVFNHVKALAEADADRN
ncbi:MAG TPA: DUF805 domain-containing protein [Candidatus Baltobacteraceae bacterium]|nr:DUF805 domain-containing protein [Candidatus Baltobacteraceae bacterium]